MDKTLPAECREPLRDLLIACADTKLLMGYHYGEWTFGAPQIESAVAHCSLAQGELGHVRLLHGILKAHFEVDPDYLVEQRPADQFASVPYLDRDLPLWESVVAMTAVVDAAVTHMIASFRDSTFAPLRSCAAKLLEEERYHLQHGRGWLRTLVQRGEHEELAFALAMARKAVIEWFGPPESVADRALVSAGVKRATDQQILHEFTRELEHVAAGVQLVGVAGAVPQLDGWTSARRRGRGAGPSEEVLYHLRGTKNAVFKVA